MNNEKNVGFDLILDMAADKLSRTKAATIEGATDAVKLKRAFGSAVMRDGLIDAFNKVLPTGEAPALLRALMSAAAWTAAGAVIRAEDETPREKLHGIDSPYEPIDLKERAEQMEGEADALWAYLSRAYVPLAQAEGWDDCTLPFATVYKQAEDGSPIFEPLLSVSDCVRVLRNAQENKEKARKEARKAALAALLG